MREPGNTQTMIGNARRFALAFTATRGATGVVPATQASRSARRRSHRPIVGVSALLCIAIGALGIDVHAQWGDGSWPRTHAGAPLVMRPSLSPAPSRLPDPRYRAPFDVWEIDRVASMVARATGAGPRGRTVVADDPRAPFAGIRGPVEDGEIIINPRAAREVPPNTWAFVVGHEFAHQIHRFEPRIGIDPETEFTADLFGAEYAMQAGFDLAAHIAWVLSRPNHHGGAHGSPHARAERLGRHFGISDAAVRQHLYRYHLHQGQ